MQHTKKKNCRVSFHSMLKFYLKYQTHKMYRKILLNVKINILTLKKKPKQQFRF